MSKKRAEGPGGGRPTGLRIGIAIQALDILGGKEREALAIASGLNARGHKVIILTRSAGLQNLSGVAVQLISANGWTNHGRARLFARAIAAQWSAGSFDVLFSFEKLREADVYYAADVCFVCRPLGILAWLPRYATYARLEAECFGADGPDILFLCRKQADEYRRHYRLGEHRAFLLPPMIHGSARQKFYEKRAVVRDSLGIPDSATVAASVAIYPMQKGIDRTISVLREFPNLYLLIVSIKDMDRIKALATNLGVVERIRFIGQSNDVDEILDAADLLLHPARLENTGRVILESLLAGVPVIASAVCGYSEYLQRFGAGIVLSEPFNASEYTASIRAALAPNTLAELRQRARGCVSQLRAEGGLDRILDLIEERLERHMQRATVPISLEA